jgi:RND family efflux transporter MFP subunit
VKQVLSPVLLFAAALASAAEPAPVTAVSLTTSRATMELRLTGTLTAERSARLSSRVDGLVARVRTDAGARVKAGETLVEIDATMAQLALRRIEANATRARTQLQESQRLLAEAKRLAAEKHIPLTTLETREAEARLAESEAASAAAALREQGELVRRHALVAPFDGVVTRKLTESGEWVTRGTTVIELVATDRVRLDVYAPQERFRDIRDDSEVRVTPDVLPGTTLTGRIAARVPVSNQDTRTFLVRILIEDPQHRLAPGTSATASIRVSRDGGPAVIVPRDALLRHADGGHSVFIVEQGEDGADISRRRNVKIGASSSAGVEVIEGLKGTERVVTHGNEILRDGQPVRLLKGS